MSVNFGENCPICSHPLKDEINTALLEEGMNIEDVAVRFSVSTDDLKFHAILHSPEDQPSITRQLKLREADLLSTVANEYVGTLLKLGKRINRYVADPDFTFEKCLTRSVVELYLGAGAEIRSTVKALADLNAQINGSQSDTKSGLMALAEAINASVPANSAG